MNYTNLWRRSIFRYVLMTIGMLLMYMFIYLHLMAGEGQVENLGIDNAFYWVASTITTVGYGDVVFTSTAGRIFSIFVQVSGVPLFFGIILTLVVTPWFERTMKIPLSTKAPKGMSGHIIICGYNRLVEVLINELKDKDMDFLIVDEEEGTLYSLMKNRIPCMYGMASEESTLERAGINSARFVIANRTDSENANIVLTARNISDIRIIALAQNACNIKYLKYAGANRVVSPKQVLGRSIAKKAVDPYLGVVSGSTEFLDGHRIVEFAIYSKSILIGKRIKDAQIPEKTGAILVGVRKAGNVTFDIRPEQVIQANNVLIAVGTTEQLDGLRKLTN